MLHERGSAKEIIRKRDHLMKHLILIIILATISTGAMAEWKLAGVTRKNVEGEFATYAETTRTFKAGNKVQMSYMLDFKTLRQMGPNKKYLSLKSQNEYDCKEGNFRGIAVSLYSEKMGGGNVVHSDSNPGNWQPVQLGSMSETLWKVACAKNQLPLTNPRSADKPAEGPPNM